jgi:hypothetical protein
MQLEFHNTKARFRVAACGRQSGKSTMCNQELLKRAWENPGTKYWFVSPTYAQAKIQYRRLTASILSSCPQILLKKNQSELRVKFLNMSEIKFVSGETYNNLRGETLHGVIIDEVRDQHEDLWPAVIRPMLSTTKGWAAFVSTPNGFDAFYELAQKAKTEKDWAFMQAPSTVNPFFTKEEYESAMRDMSEAYFAQEILAEFRDLTSGKVYKGFTKDNILERSPFVFESKNESEYSNHVSPFLPIILGADFNVSPMCWILGQNRLKTWYFFKEIKLDDSSTQEAADELISILITLRNENLLKANPNLIVTGDASGNARQRAAAAMSDYDILFQKLKQANISFESRVPDANTMVKDRVNAVNALLNNSNGEKNLFVNKNCKWVIRDFERVVWKNNSSNTLDKTDKSLTHMSDALGYAIQSLTPIESFNNVGELTVLRR